MEPFGLNLALFVALVGFGLMIGTLFGFFGMGGSFLVTPALLVLGYPAQVAVGSGLAFVFGTSVIGAIKHRDLGHVDYTLAAIMTVAMTVGIEGGKFVVLFLKETGLADLVISTSYVGLLAAVGLFTLRESRASDDGAGCDLSRAVQGIDLPPMVTLRGDVRVSGVVIAVTGLAVGVLSGFLGVGGGFLLMPAMLYGFGVPATVAVGTDILQITVSGAYGAFSYALVDAVAVPSVAAMLLGSALGARVGAGATKLVDEDGIKRYFAAMMLAGSLAVAAKQLGAAFGIEVLTGVSVVLIFGSAFLVSGAVVLAAICRLQGRETGPWCRFTTS
ncbi:MAG: sulfite exporter TauE/SafE family protein [Halobacteriales archaeon]|nr:sulfite exporter TauE/SafE family protein [Halobacteriales archaeon]